MMEEVQGQVRRSTPLRNPSPESLCGLSAPLAALFFPFFFLLFSDFFSILLVSHGHRLRCQRKPLRSTRSAMCAGFSFSTFIFFSFSGPPLSLRPSRPFSLPRSLDRSRSRRRRHSVCRLGLRRNDSCSTSWAEATHAHARYEALRVEDSR